MALKLSRFPEFPPEIRLQIWQSALPAHDKPSLFPWRLGCWQLTPIPPSDPAYDPAAPDFPRLEFNHNRLHPLRCKASSLTPLLWVCGEARHVALAWVVRSGFEISLQGVFTRTFDPELDALFLPWLMKDDESDTTLLDTRSVFYNELFERLQSPEALDAIRREAERRQRLKYQEQQELTGVPGAVIDIEDIEEADYRKVDPWSAVSRIAIPARRSRSEGEWTLLPHFFPCFDTLFVLAPLYNAPDGAQLNGLTCEGMKMRRLYDLDPAREISYIDFDDRGQFSWRGSWDRDESLLLSDDPEALMKFKGDVDNKTEVVDGLLVVNIEDCVKDLGSGVRSTHDKKPFRFRPVPSWWTET